MQNRVVELIERVGNEEVTSKLEASGTFVPASHTESMNGSSCYEGKLGAFVPASHTE